MQKTRCLSEFSCLSENTRLYPNISRKQTMYVSLHQTAPRGMSALAQYCLHFVDKGGERKEKQKIVQTPYGLSTNIISYVRIFI